MASRAYARVFHAMLEQGVYLAPSAFEAASLSLAHIQEDVESTLRAAQKALTR